MAASVRHSSDGSLTRQASGSFSMPAHTCPFSASWPDFCLTQGKNHKKQNGAKFIFRMLVPLPLLLPQHHQRVPLFHSMLNAKSSPATVSFSPQRHRNNSTFRNILNGDTQRQRHSSGNIEICSQCVCNSDAYRHTFREVVDRHGHDQFRRTGQAAHLYTSPESHLPCLQT